MSGKFRENTASWKLYVPTCFVIVAASGCDISVRPPSSHRNDDRSQVNHQEDKDADTINGISKLDRQLGQLEKDVRVINAELSTEIATIREQARGKVDKADAVKIVQQELNGGLLCETP